MAGRWTHEEDQVIWEGITFNRPPLAMAPKLPNRSVQAIHNRKHLLKTEGRRTLRMEPDADYGIFSGPEYEEAMANASRRYTAAVNNLVLKMRMQNAS